MSTGFVCFTANVSREEARVSPKSLVYRSTAELVVPGSMPEAGGPCRRQHEEKTRRVLEGPATFPTITNLQPHRKKQPCALIPDTCSKRTWNRWRSALREDGEYGLRKVEVVRARKSAGSRGKNEMCEENTYTHTPHTHTSGPRRDKGKNGA